MFSTSVSAATDEADISVGMKTLPLLSDAITGTTFLAIIYDPSNAASVKEADGIKSIIDRKLETPDDLKLVGTLVPVGELQKLSASKIAFLTGELGSYYNAIGTVSARNHVLTMSTDLGCVQANQCVLGITSKPHVQIYFSQGAANAAQITFGQVFMMLVKKI